MLTDQQIAARAASRGDMIANIRPPARLKPLTTAVRRALAILDTRGTARVAAARPHPTNRDRLDVASQTARALMRAGWATGTCHIDQRDVVLTATGRYEDPGQLRMTAEGRRELHRIVPDQPVFFTDGGAIKYRALPREQLGSRGRWVVDDGIPDRERGYSTARGYETDDGNLEAHGLTTNPGRKSRTSGDVERQDPDDIDPRWRREAEEERAAAQDRRAKARSMASRMRAA